MMVLQRHLACLALVVILSAATVSAAVQKPAGVVTCAEDGFSMVITKAHEANKVEKIDVKIGTGKTADGNAEDTDCVYTGGKDVVNPGGATLSQNDISGKLKLSYGTDTTGVAGKAKCQGTLKDNAGLDTIEYTVEVEVVVRQTIRTVIDREIKWKFNLVCQLTKAVDAKAGTQGWTIDRAALTAESTGGDDTKSFTFGLEINFFPDGSTEGTIGAAAIPDNHQYVMGTWVHIQVKETTPNALFKFVTKKCWFSPASASSTHDIFFDQYCPIVTDSSYDDYTEISNNLDSKFEMKVKAFFFTATPGDKISVTCDLFICLTADTTEACTQRPRTPAKDATPKGCAMTGGRRRRRNALPELLRKRRSVDEDKNRGWIEHRVVTSKQAILLDRNDVIVPTCGGDFVYDRVSKSCSNENLLEISGVYLDLPWNVEYANTSSQTFKDFANGKAYQLYALMQMTDSANVIRGLEVVSAKKGSVILTVRIKYSETSNAASAFEVFQRAIDSVPSSQSATSNILNIRSEKVIEYVEVKRASPSSGLNVENLTLIIVIVVLCAAVFISVIAVLKVRHARRGASSNAGSEMKAHDNPNFS